MDSITQATLGAAIGEAMLGKKIGKKGALLGALIATLPDLDVLLLPFFNDLQRLSIHRGFSHSILFSLIGAVLIALLLSKIKWSSNIKFVQLTMFSWLALITHMILDAFTTYGTQLFLPFNNLRVSFDSINIIDPLYTLPLLIGVLFSVYFQNQKTFYRANTIGLIISTFYLSFTLFNKSQINNLVKYQLTEQKIQYKSLKTIPVGIGNINWYGVAKSRDSLYIGKYSKWYKNKILFHSFPINENLLKKIDTQVVKRLKWLSQDFYTVAEQDGKIRLYNLQCDMQGIRTFGIYKAPTAFYFEVKPNSTGSLKIETGMHQKDE